MEKFEINSPNQFSQDTILVEIYLKSKDLPTIIIVPGAAGHKKGKYASVYNDIIDKFIETGFNSVVFSPRGQIGSSGYYSSRQTTEDLNSIVNYLSYEKISIGKIGMFGRSAGAIISMLYSDEANRIQSIAVWGTPTHLYERHYKNQKERNEMFTNLRANGTCIIDDTFLKDLVNAEDAIGSVETPIMLGWGTDDLKYSSYQEQIDLIRLAENSPLTQLNIINDCGHSLNKNDQMFDFYYNIFINWFKITLCN